MKENQNPYETPQAIEPPVVSEKAGTVWPKRLTLAIAFLAWGAFLTMFIPEQQSPKPRFLSLLSPMLNAALSIVGIVCTFLLPHSSVAARRVAAVLALPAASLLLWAFMSFLE